MTHPRRSVLNAQGRLRAGLDRPANTVHEFRRHLTRRDVQDVFVVDVEDLGHEPGTHGVGLAEIVIDRDPHGSILPPRRAHGHRQARQLGDD